MTDRDDVVSNSFEAGIWQVRLARKAGASRPALSVRLREAPLDGLTITDEADAWRIEVPVPPSALGDGAHTLILSDRSDGMAVARLGIVAGRVLADDLVAEIDALRAEVERVKAALRAHLRAAD